MSKFLDLEGLSVLVNGIKNGDLVPGKVTATSIDGVISVDNLPQGALERLIVVASDTARFALTKTQAQIGDTVKVTATGKMYYIKDDSKLSSADGYEEYTVGTASSVPWSGVTSKPSFATVATSGKYSDLSGTPVAATTSAAGLMSAADKTKLNGIAAGANNYVLPTATSAAIGGVQVNATAASGSINAPSTATGRNYVLQLGTDGKTGVVNVPWTDTTYSAATSSKAGLLSAADKAKLDGIASGANAYTLPAATSTALGGVKVNATAASGTLESISTAAGRTYAIQLGTDAKTAVVNVPWTDTTYSAATQSAAGLLSAADKKKLDGITAGANAYTLPTAGTALGGIKTGYTTSGKNYKVQVDSSGNAFVNVPWADTTYSAATTSAAGLMSAADKTKLDGISAITSAEIEDLF